MAQAADLRIVVSTFSELVLPLGTAELAAIFLASLIIFMFFAALLCEWGFSREVELNFEDLGFHAAKRLLKIIHGSKASLPHLKIPPSHVEKRLSTDFLAVEDTIAREALCFIHQPLSGPVSVAVVASEIGVSRRVLEKHFLRATGKTVFTEIHSARMERARRLVGETSLPVEIIASRIGLNDQRHFIRLFKKEHGKTPFAWCRRKCLTEARESRSL